jgi:hypothetical protein
MRIVKSILLVTLVLFNAFLLLAIVSLRGVRSDEHVAPRPSGNGDANCDGQIDIADPVYVLNWLFGAVARTWPRESTSSRGS